MVQPGDKDSKQLIGIWSQRFALYPEEVRVELYANKLNGAECEKYEMIYKGNLQEQSNVSIYSVTIPLTRSASDYTPQIIPKHADTYVPLECNCTLWQR